VRIPLGRFGTTDLTADLAVMMLTNGYLTGKIYLLGGGIYPTDPRQPTHRCVDLGCVTAGTASGLRSDFGVVG